MLSVQPDHRSTGFAEGELVGCRNKGNLTFVHGRFTTDASSAHQLVSARQQTSRTLACSRSGHWITLDPASKMPATTTAGLAELKRPLNAVELDSPQANALPANGVFLQRSSQRKVHASRLSDLDRHSPFDRII